MFLYKTISTFPLGVVKFSVQNLTIGFNDTASVEIDYDRFTQCKYILLRILLYHILYWLEQIKAVARALTGLATLR
jgi:hypothetical protein